MDIRADPFSVASPVAGSPCQHRVAKLYALLRSRFTAAVAQDMHLITKASPRVAEALALLESFLAANPKTSFRLFRLEDMAMTEDTSSRTFVR